MKGFKGFGGFLAARPISRVLTAPPAPSGRSSGYGTESNLLINIYFLVRSIDVIAYTQL